MRRCLDCNDLFTDSEWLHLCQFCGEAEYGKLELRERDEVVEWWRISAMVTHGESREVRRRWEIR